MYNYTPEDLILYFYGEMPADEAAILEARLKEDWTLREKMAVFQMTSRRLNQSLISPGTDVINRIMDYARASCGEQALAR
jgi:anti-sigma factor RsiW